MSRMSSSRVTSAAGRVETCSPSRSTVIQSAIWNTSSSRWVMNSTVTPRSRNWRAAWKSCPTSCSESEAVGSSMIRTFTSSEIAFAISTACCAARVSPRAGARTSRRTPRLARIPSASAYMRRQLVSSPCSRWVMKMFSATSKSGNSSGSW